MKGLLLPIALSALAAMLSPGALSADELESLTTTVASIAPANVISGQALALASPSSPVPDAHTTKLTTAYVTYCAAATQVTYGSATYTVTEATILAIPLTVTVTTTLTLSGPFVPSSTVAGLAPNPVAFGSSAVSGLLATESSAAQSVYGGSRGGASGPSTGLTRAGTANNGSVVTPTLRPIVPAATGGAGAGSRVDWGTGLLGFAAFLLY